MSWLLPGACLSFMNLAWTRCRCNSSPSLQFLLSRPAGSTYFSLLGSPTLTWPLRSGAGQCEPNKEAEYPERLPPVCLFPLEAWFPACACKYLTYLLILPFVWVLWTQQVSPNDFRQYRRNPALISPWVKWQVRPVNRILTFSKAQLPVETCSPAACPPQRYRARTGGGKMSIDMVCAPLDIWFYLKRRLDSWWESCELHQGEQWYDVV